MTVVNLEKPKLLSGDERLFNTNFSLGSHGE